MASGKSVELQSITRSKGDPICIKPGCGKLWSEHVSKRVNKDGYRERLKKYQDLDHRVLGTLRNVSSRKLSKAEHKREKKQRLSGGK